MSKTEKKTQENEKKSVPPAMDLPKTDANSDQAAQDLTQFVQNLLEQMHSRFQQMSNSIITKLDDMGKRLDDLERSIGELMTQSGVEEDLPAQQIAKPTSE